MNNSFSIIKIITGLSKTLNVVKELVPVYNQIKPYMKKSSSFINNLNNLNNFNNIPNINNNTNNIKKINNNSPTFFQ